MGYSEQEFWEMTPRFFFNALAGYEKREKLDWERSRMVGYLAMAPHINPRKRLTPQQIWPFPWDKERRFEFEEMSREDFERIREKHRKALAQFREQKNASRGNNR